MKPIELKLAGLQSYREMQTIDFARLCEAGVFGIFGPTGSGKSTLLDAMTLALYGQVERAQNGTQGILNQAEDMLFVSYTFELSRGQHRERYRVERQFKRSQDVSVNSTVCRLLRLDGEQEKVLADKQREVNVQVQSLLGLTMQDFTRAVVLPQGKFAEFLSLKGRDRREMLQRLFRLERYGDLLNLRLSRRVKENETALKEIEAEQQGIGDASAKALEEAEQRCREAHRESEARRRNFLERDGMFLEAKQIREWQVEKQKGEREKERLKAADPAIRQMEARIEQSEQAEKLRPYLEQHERAVLREEEAARKIREAGQLYEKTLRERDEARKRHEQAAQELAGREEPLLIRLQQFREALDWEREADQFAGKKAELEEQFRKKERELREAETSLAALETKLEKAVRKQERLKAELKTFEVPSERRRQLQQMDRDRQHLAFLGKRCEDQDAERKKKRDALDNERRRTGAIRDEKRAQLGQLRTGWIHFRQWRGSVTAMTAQLERLESAIQLEAERSERMERERERSELARRLAEQLEDGRPCPVCGSLHHPALKSGPSHADESESPAKSPESGTSSEWRELAATIRDVLNEFGQIVWQADALESRFREFFSEEFSRELPASPTAAGEAAAALHPEFPEMDGSGNSPDGLREDPAVAWDSLQKPLADLKESWNGIRKNGETLLLECRNREFALREAELALKAAEQGCRDAEERAREYRREYERHLEAWRRQYPEDQPDRVEEKIRALQEQDRMAEQWRERLDKSVAFIDQTEKEIREWREILHRLQRETDRLERERNLLTEQLADRLERLRERLGSRSAADLIRETERELERLRQREKELGEIRDACQQAYERAAEQYGAARKAHETAQEEKRETGKQWLRHLDLSDFASAGEVREALLDAGEKERMEREIRAHREAEKRWQIEAERLDKLLQGRSLTDREWEAEKKAWEEARTANEEALQALARAERDRDDLAGKHERWKALERERKERSQLQERLGKLQRVLRGNAFVEYMAEEQLMQVTRDASARLGQLTRQRYAIEVDSGGGFLIRDDANGGVRRPIATLSGGETFLTSLSLALALSAQIQLRGRYPLEFFFLDEGFGTLDPELLETVVTALEKLHMDHLTVGVISHVPELRARLPRKLIVSPAEPSGRGSRVEIETL